MGSEMVLQLLQRHGPIKASELCRLAGISQPSLSRHLGAISQRVVVSGRARSTIYAAKRPVEGLPDRIPVFEVRPQKESPRLAGWLVPVYPQGYLFQDSNQVQQAFSRDLPWFLQDLRLSGFLGRLQARRANPFGFPEDIRLWSSEQVLRYLCAVGWDSVGAFIVGEGAYKGFLEEAVSPTTVVDAGKRGERYPEIASQVAAFGRAGSSAGGEQPKFLATVAFQDELRPVLVKYSPPAGNPLAQRICDLLVAEHLALECLAEAGIPAVRTTLLESQGRTFLEVERFDRQGLHHRVGQASLSALDAEYVGSDLNSWVASVRQLAHQGIVPANVLPTVGFLELFGRLIGNSDMHFGNLAFLLDSRRVAGLAPAYDMLPMHFFPSGHELDDRPFPLPSLSVDQGSFALAAVETALRFWALVAADPRISGDFQVLAKAQAQRLAAVRTQAGLLPAP